MGFSSAVNHSEKLQKDNSVLYLLSLIFFHLPAVHVTYHVFVSLSFVLYFPNSVLLFSFLSQLS